MLRTITSFGFIAAAILVIVVLVIPRYQGVQTLRAQEAELKQALENSKMLQESWDELLDRYNAINPTNLTKLDLLMPANVDNVKLIIELDSLASSLGLQINSIDTTEVANSSNTDFGSVSDFGQVTMTLQMSGDYQDMVSFLDRIETSLRLMDLESFDIATNVSELGAVEYQYSITVRTYWLRNQSVASTT